MFIIIDNNYLLISLIASFVSNVNTVFSILNNFLEKEEKVKEKNSGQRVQYILTSIQGSVPGKIQPILRNSFLKS